MQQQTIQQKKYQKYEERVTDYVVYFDWTYKVKKRDGNKCVYCGSPTNITAHHIFYKKKYPKLSFNLNNGITLCATHHRELHRLN